MTTVERIELELEKKGIKPATMSKDLGFSSGLFSQWRYGKQKPSSEKLYKIAEYLNVSIDYLTGNNEIPIEDTVKTYLFGTSDVDEEIFNQVKQYAKFLIKERSDNMYIPTPNELKDINISENCKQRVANGGYLYESEVEEIANSLAISKDKIIGNRNIREDRKPIASIEDVGNYSQKPTAARGDYSTSEKPDTERLNNIPTMDNE